MNITIRRDKFETKYFVIQWFSDTLLTKFVCDLHMYYFFGLDSFWHLDLAIGSADSNNNLDQILVYFFIIYLGTAKKIAYS